MKHHLLDEGAAYDETGYRLRPGRGTGGGGCGKCRCGAVSPWLSSGNQRKAWYRVHKQNATVAG